MRTNEGIVEGKEERLTVHPGTARHPVVSDDGTLIAFGARRGGTFAVWTIDTCLYESGTMPNGVLAVSTSSGESKSILERPNYHFYQAQFGGNDQWIAFIAVPTHGSEHRAKLFSPGLLSESGLLG